MAQFRDLPPELRLFIYEEALKDPRIRSATVATAVPPYHSTVTPYASPHETAILKVHELLAEIAAYNIPAGFSAHAHHGPGLIQARIYLSLSNHMTQHLHTLTTNRSALDLQRDLGHTLATYPRLRRLELRGSRHVLYVAKRIMRPLIRNGVQTFTAPQHSAARFGRHFHPRFRTTITAQSVVVVIPCRLANHRNVAYLNGNGRQYRGVRPLQGPFFYCSH
jgi:hypothetical protein